MTTCIALVVAAGRGTRLGADIPKQYLPLAGKPIIRHTVEALLRHRAVTGLRVVYHPDDEALYDAALTGLDLLPPVAGGETRQDSVRLGLESLVPLAPDRVLIHDAARPFVDERTIDAVMGILEDRHGAVPGIAVADTLKRVVGTRVTETVDRAQLWRVQTPQGFHFDQILKAHRAAAGADLPDDAAVAERLGIPVKVFPSREENFKVTTRHDLTRAERIVMASLGDVRTGQGFDVHAFGPGDHVWMCGIRVPHEQALIGHSDADVGLHALTDAILGALGAGDIGMHFPPSDPQWRGAPSHVFLSHAASLVAKAGGMISHLDVTIICERPRVGPHRDAMVARVAEILSLDLKRVSVKATTTEKLGFTGRGEGIAATAIATIRLPG